MGQSSSTQKPKPVQKSTWRPEVLLTEACDTSNYDPISIRKRRNSEALPVQRGPNKKDINKAIKFVQDFLPLYTSPNEVNISIGTSPLVAMDIETFSYNRALTDSKVQGEIKRVCSAAHKNSVFAKDLFNEQAGNIFKKFSFANQKEELIQAPNKFFKVGSFARSHSTPDISKYVAEGGNEKARDKDNQDITVNAFGTPIRTGRETEFENRNSASFHSHNSPEKRDQNKVGGQYRDIIQDSQNYPGFRPTEREQNNDLSVSVDQTKKQSISFRIESKDQSKASEEDLGFRANTQVKPQAPPAPIRGVIGLPEGHQAQAESQEKILIQNTYNEKVSHQEPQGYQYVNPPPASPSKYNQRVQVQNPLQTQQYVANTNRNLQAEEKNLYNNAKNVSQQQQAVRKEVNKPQIASQKYPSKQWPSLSPVSDRRDRSKENTYNEKHQLKKQSKISSDKSPVKKERQHEPIAQKREEYMSQNNPQRNKNDPLRQSNLVQSSQGYKTNKVEKSPMSLKQVKSQGRYDLNVTERNNYQSQPMKVQKNIDVTPQQTTPQQPRTNKWLTDAHKMQVSNSSPQFNVDVNPINVDLNLDELLRAADRNGGYGIQNVTPGVYANYNDGFSPNFNSRFSSRFQEHQNPATQYISPKQLDETAYYEENSQFDRRNNSFLHSRHDISQDLNDHSMDNSQLNNSYVRRNKYGNALQPEVLAHRFTQNPEYH